MTIAQRMRDNNSVIAVNYPAALLRLSVREGMACADVMANTGVSAKALETSKGFVPFEVYKQMIHNAYQALNKPFLGLLLGSELGLTTHGMLGMAALASVTYGDAVKITARYFKCRFPVFECLYRETDHYILLELRERQPIDEVKMYLIESIYASLKDVSGMLIGECSEHIMFEFDFPQPSYLGYYQQVLGDKLNFDQPYNRMLLPKKIQLAALKMAEPLTRQLAENSCEKVLQHLPQQSSIAEVIRAMLTQDEYGCVAFNIPTVEKVAAKLNMSPRTLRRRLKLEAISFQALIDEVRKKMALRYLNDTKLSITQISSQLGFNDAAYFSKSFKKWVGMSPTQYRER